MLKRLTLLMVLLALLTACAPAAPENRPTGTPENRSTLTPPPTATPTEAPTPTATEAPVEQIDLKPNYEQKVAVEYMGVQINASLITDESLDPVITKVTVGEKAYAEFLARSLYKVWLKKGGPEGSGPATDTTFEQFMALWATAQQSGQEADWRQVQIKNIWANDIPTPGYEQHPYTIWFMHAGQTPEDVRGISQMSVAFISIGSSRNITVMNEEGWGMGTNIFSDNLYFYDSVYPGYYDSRSLASGLSGTPWWLIRNRGGNISGYGQEDVSLRKLLINGGISVE